MTNGEILAVSKILLESRAFTREEINSILDKLISGCIPPENVKLVSDLIANEKYHYVELRNKMPIKEKLWELGNYIRQCELIEMTYEKQLPEKQTVKRIIEPAALLFSEYYFYLNGYIVEKREETYQRLYDHPAIFRVDRIQKCRKIGEKFHVAYIDRFQEGEFRKRVQFMFAGELVKLQFRYFGAGLDAILDRIPTAEIVESSDAGYIIEAEVFGRGILMWLLSQGSAVEIIKPASLREEMKQMIQNMLKNYE